MLKLCQAQYIIYFTKAHVSAHEGNTSLLRSSACLQVSLEVFVGQVHVYGGVGCSLWYSQCCSSPSEAVSANNFPDRLPDVEVAAERKTLFRDTICGWRA